MRPSSRWNLGIPLACLVGSIGAIDSAHAIQLTALSGAIHLPNSSYHLVAFEAAVAFKTSKSAEVFAQFGMIPPFSVHGFSQNIYFFSTGGVWSSAPSGFRFYGGVGLGAYIEQVNSSLAVVPSFMASGGIRLGAEKIGFQLGLESYVGVTSFTQFLNYSVAWPLFNVLGGIYVGI